MHSEGVFLVFGLKKVAPKMHQILILIHLEETRIALIPGVDQYEVVK